MTSILNNIEESCSSGNDNIEVEDEDLVISENGGDENEEEENSENSGNSAPNNDFCFTLEDFLPLPDNAAGMRHRQVYAKAQEHIEALNGRIVEVGKGDECIRWKVVTGVFEDELKDTLKAEGDAYEMQKLHYFDDSPNKFDMLLKLWPGDFWDDYKALNEYIEEVNVDRKKQLQKVYRSVSKSEFVIFHALFILASQCSRIGTKLWNPSSACSFVNNIDFSPYMKEWRFKELRMLIPSIMRDESVKEVDDWWRFSKRVKDFNATRKRLRRSSINVLDESMSAFVPR